MTNFADVKDLSAHIEYLLMQQDAVSLPTIGTLTIKTLSAHYNESDHTFLPPTKNVLFEANEKTEDDTLERLLMRLHRLSHDMARALVNDYVADLRESLISQGEAECGNIGQFTQDEAGVVRLSPCEAGLAVPDLFALDAVHIRHQKKEKSVVRYIDNTDKEYITIRLSRKVVRRTVRVAASLLVALLIMVPGVRVFGRYDVPAQIEAGISNIYVNIADRLYNGDNISDCNDTSVDKVSTTCEAEDTEAENTANTHQENTDNVEKEGAYCIVLASSTTEQNAKNFIASLQTKGITGATIMAERRNNLKRVVIDGFVTEEEAIAKARELRNMDDDLFDIWTAPVK